MSTVPPTLIMTVEVARAHFHLGQNRQNRKEESRRWNLLSLLLVPALALVMTPRGVVYLVYTLVCYERKGSEPLSFSLRCSFTGCVDFTRVPISLDHFPIVALVSNHLSIACVGCLALLSQPRQAVCRAGLWLPVELVPSD